ncbi:hypothetical protein [Flavobacterium sp. LB3R33]|uniref:hypothetical protein n=1 Tax=Flavobacterium sp. LB3R33 TaxID=3401721 RepID=UPI003AB020EB
MNKITFEEYKSAIKGQYEENKNVDVSGILLNPTPAQLRNLCLMIFDNSLSKSDENIFKLFFNVKEEQSIRKCIANYDIARFRPIISFLKGEKDSENTTRIELTAILVDFNPRPYSKYLLNGKIITGSTIAVASLEKEMESEIDYFSAESWVKKAVEPENNVRIMNKKVIILTVFLSLFFMGYTVKNLIFPEKECMKWEGDHYEAVDCKNEKLGISQLELIIPIDENIMKLNKLDSNRKINFFKNDKPLVWYCKHDGVVELFNTPGFHPETGKPLKPITKYIIKKYNLKK